MGFGARHIGRCHSLDHARAVGHARISADSAPSQQKALRNHPSWENDENAKRSLGPVIAKWLASGVLEYVACDKDLSGIMIDGFVFRFAACHFGQNTSGSPLGSIVRAVARYFAQLPDPVHVASWVDDLIFIMSTPEHGECAGFVGGCPVCTEYHGRALKVQELWHAKARKLNVPLSARGHPVDQSGAFTGVAIDSFQGRLSMLPDIPFPERLVASDGCHRSSEQKGGGIPLPLTAPISA